MTKRGFGELEQAILRILKLGQRTSVKEVHTILGGENKYTTIMTVMLRLTQKKVLAREKIGAHYEYWLLSPPRTFMEGIKRKLFGVKPVELISYLIESENEISDEELLEMEQMLEKAKQKRRK